MGKGCLEAIYDLMGWKGLSIVSGGFGWGGGGHVACRILEMAISYVSVAKKSLCPLSNLRNGNVTCHYRFTTSGSVTKTLCRMSNLRNGHVAMSNLYKWSRPILRAGSFIMVSVIV